VSTSRQLYQLQLVDSRWDQNRQRLLAVEGSLGQSQDLVLARQAVKEAEGVLAELKVQLRVVDLDVGAVSSKLKQNQDRLYGGRVRNPKELANLQEEAAALRRRQSELEDAQLELMISVEDQEAELAERQARARQIEATWLADQARLEAEKDELELQLADLDEERAAMRSQIAAGALAGYDALRQRLGGAGVALLKRGTCQGCGVDVPTSLVGAVERDRELQHCPICGRILSTG
jgi:predicted  nucleic acid-binding Zn-ribbon protein